MTPQQSQPNLFDYATSELSQDAFICWLAAWADPKWKDTDSALHQAGQEFVASMIHKVRSDYDLGSIKTVHVDQQVKFLDVLIEINKDSDDFLAILVEDKIHARQGHNQLKNHLENARSKHISSSIIPIYLKTGYQSRFDDLGEFELYSRENFLIVLKKGKANGVDNAIYNDFLSSLEEMDAAVQQFSMKELGHWNDNDWMGFFMALYPYLKSYSADWRHVNNQSNQFFGFWWYFKIVPGSTYMPYLQLEEKCLVFKIEVKNQADDRRVARDEACRRIMEATSKLNVNIGRPKKMGSGKSMTVARWSNDYRVFSDGKLDFDATLANLKKAQQILDAAFDDKQPAQPL